MKHETELKNEIDLDMYQLHACDLQPANVTIIHDRQLDVDNAVWRMEITRQATEEDLEENHYLETTDDLVWQTAVEIYHCPYCGEKLCRQEIATGLWQAMVKHFDYSGWTVKTC